MSVPVLVLSALETVVNRLLAMDPDVARRMGALGDKAIAVEVEGPGWTVYLLPGTEVVLLGHYDGEPDLTLHGAPLALARMAGGHIAFGGEVQVRGDLQLAGRLQTILQDLDIDWEEQLAKVVGDIPAHQAGNLWRHTADYLSDTAETLGMDLEEYLKEELRLLPQRYEVEEFFDAVDELRNDEARLEARIARIEAGQASIVNK